jgi:predicted dehydrogenase
MKKIKIAQIGTSANSHGNPIFGSLQKQSDMFEIAGFAMPENERDKFPGNMKLFKGFREMTVDEILNDASIEAVAVETEEIYLTKYALMAAKAGKHIHMEKPGGREISQFEELIDTVKAGKTVFHTGYMYRYNPYVIDLLKRIKEGELGDIISVEAQMNCRHPESVRSWLSAFPGGMMFFLGCHLIDLIYRIQGEPKKIIPLNRSTGYLGASGEDFGMAIFEYDRGVSFAKTCAVERGGFARRQLVVTGTEGTVEIKPFEMSAPGGIWTGKIEFFSDAWADRGVYTETAVFDRYDAMMNGFGRMVRGEIENPYTYDYELGLYRTVLRACNAL